MPRVKKHLQTVGYCVALEEWTETYQYRVDLGDKEAYLDEESIKGRGLIRMDQKDGKVKSSSYTSVEFYPELAEAIKENKVEKGEWTFVFEMESDYS